MDKREYEVAEGVTWVNGAKVPATREVSLTAKEATYDLSLNRIWPKGSRRTKSAKAPAAAPVADGSEVGPA
ncbi:hypothetical protein [Amorphus orientalis]|uniref:Uncharacterized protein n=1 Tax=Amorphus orientalis TaxID=649198 RepID=A0AAE4ASB5_9HYPH|nr:hypothetical protein [Amorphus orientalis]MDQ0314850.1 hypothetical protein [Amorphus orientalis]